MSRSPSTVLPLLAFVLFAVVLGVAGQPPALAQTGVTGAHTWQIQVDNVSPEGEVWSFNAFYPARLQAHAGDTITLRVATNPNAFHFPVILHNGFMPLQAYSGFMFEDPYIEGELQTTFFHNTANILPAARMPCGREGQSPCLFDASRPIQTAMLISPPPGSGGTGNPSFTLTIDPMVAVGSYYFLCNVHGPGMGGRLDILAPSEPAQSDAVVAANARREYEADLLELTRVARTLSVPSFEVNRMDGSKMWHIATGAGTETRLAVNAFGTRMLAINPGDVVTWDVEGPSGVFHAISGFGDGADSAAARLNVLAPGCERGAEPSMIPTVAPPRPTGRTPPPFRNSVTTVATSEDEFVFDPDIWNTCPGQELMMVEEASVAAPPSGTAYSSGPVTSGILMSRAFLDGIFGHGLPFRSDYSLRFMQPGIYHYACVIHYGMEGWINVRPRGPEPGDPGLP